ncbi:MAG: DNA mismatch repair endonuclease MutL [Ruminococcaceae bacterium]|nr:DNA mismatch repair endonuclease MutL [Oscillospiraceae bacterium]
MGKINLLETQVANLIAAGEVVERPASAIKELMENAIDAGATRITAEIKNGGVSLMRITDNGCGMTREDALLCIRRHATSKIKTASDLDGIVTLGFRGEALAAIASVSKLRIMTRTADQELGAIVTCEAGAVVSVEESGCPLGTTILVEELFANVPARRKFLKRDASETAAVAAVLEKIALSRPDIAIKFIADGTLRFQTAGDGHLQNVVYAVLGRDFAKKMVKVHDMTEGVEVEGFIGTPDNCRGNRAAENFFINGRYVRCGTASAALEQAFSSYIPSDKFPACVLSITINPAFVDVNVHPQKMEVKFSNDKPIFNAVYCAVRNTLMHRIDRPQAPDTTKLSADSYRLYNDILTMKTATDAEADTIADEKERLSRRYEQLTVPADIKATTPAFAGEPPVTESQPLPPSATPTPVSDPVLRKENHSFSVSLAAPPSITVEPLSSDTIPTVTISSPTGAEISPIPSEEASPTVTAEAPAVPWFRIAGVAFHCYIFVEMENAMLIIDKHAAHERVLFEQMRENLKRLAPPASQLLLLPLELQLNGSEIAAVEEYRDELEKIGFAFTGGEENGQTAILRYPSGLTESQATAMFAELASRLADGSGDISVTREIFYEKALYQASCKAAVKAGQLDTPETLSWIAEQVIVNPRVRFCPHGRPVAFEMTKSQFEKQFERL